MGLNGRCCWIVAIVSEECIINSYRSIEANLHISLEDKVRRCSCLYSTWMNPALHSLSASVASYRLILVPYRSDVSKTSQFILQLGKSCRLLFRTQLGNEIVAGNNETMPSLNSSVMRSWIALLVFLNTPAVSYTNVCRTQMSICLSVCVWL